MPDRLADPVIAMWDELRFARQPASATDLILASGLRTAAAFDLLDRWQRAGLIILASSRPESYTMSSTARSLRAPPACPPRTRKTRAFPAGPDIVRYRIWYTLRQARRIDLGELCKLAEVSRKQAATYLSLLVRHGYISRIYDAFRHPVYMLLRDPGPEHPRLSAAPRSEDMQGSKRATPSASLFFEPER